MLLLSQHFYSSCVFAISVFFFSFLSIVFGRPNDFTQHKINVNSIGSILRYYYMCNFYFAYATMVWLYDSRVLHSALYLIIPVMPASTCKYAASTWYVYTFVCNILAILDQYGIQYLIAHANEWHTRRCRKCVSKSESQSQTHNTAHKTHHRSDGCPVHIALNCIALISRRSDRSERETQ